MSRFKIYDSDISIAISTNKSQSEIIKNQKIKSIKDYLFYMHEGAVVPPLIFEYYLKNELNGVFDENGIIIEDDFEIYSNSILKNRGKLRLFGVIEIDRLVGYKLIQDYLDSKMLIENVTNCIGKYFDLDQNSLRYVAALHKGTKDRHVHFLIYSSKDNAINNFDCNNSEFENYLVSQISKYLNSDGYQNYLKDKYLKTRYDLEEYKKLKTNRKRLEIELKSLSIIEYFKENRELEFSSYDNLDEVVQMSVDDISEKIIFVNQKFEEDYVNRKEKIMESFLFIKNEEMELIKSFDCDIKPVKEKVFEFLKENIVRQRFLYDVNISEDMKKEIGRNNLLEYNDNYLKLEKEIMEMYKKFQEKCAESEKDKSLDIFYFNYD